MDSLEHIDFSLCTLEFEVRRDSYYWLLEALDLWRPKVWEFARLNVTYSLLSKRKILKMISTGIVRGWDDPRLFTLMGLRRRGYPPEAINNFCRDIGVSRIQSTIEVERLEYHIRSYLDVHAPRTFAVMNPLRVELVNVGPEECFALDAPWFPKDASRGSQRMYLSRVMYIERDDFRTEDSKSYYGLAPGKTVGLRYAGLLTCVDVLRNSEGEVTSLRCEYSHERTSKPKGNLHFVSSKPGEEPIRAEVRLYNNLFRSPFPGEETGNWEDDVNVDSEVVLTNSLVAPAVREAPVESKFQFERVGFFVVDQDSNEERIVLNRTVTLKASAEAKAVRG